MNADLLFKKKKQIWIILVYFWRTLFTLSSWHFIIFYDHKVNSPATKRNMAL